VLLVSMTSIAVISSLGLILVGWLVLGWWRKRQRNRAISRFRPAQTRPAQAGPVSGRTVTVDELIKRTQAEGLPIRLRWDTEDEDTRVLDDGDWPTGILPPTPSESDR